MPALHSPGCSGGWRVGAGVRGSAAAALPQRRAHRLAAALAHDPAALLFRPLPLLAELSLPAELSKRMEVPEERASRFKFARQNSKLAGTIRGSYPVVKDVLSGGQGNATPASDADTHRSIW